MTDQQHPITPPPELVSDWRLAPEYTDGLGKLTMVTITVDRLQYIATQAARWGADQELEACLNEIYKGVGLRLIPYGSHRELLCSDLRAARRPKPPNLKKQALGAFGRFTSNAHTQASQMIQDFEIIRSALEQLDD